MEQNKSNTNSVNKGGGVSLLIKIVGLSSIFVLLAILILAIMSIINMRALSLETSVLMGKNKLKGDIAAFERMLTEEYGQLRLENGQLLDERNNILNERYVVVDQISSMLDIVATIFVRDTHDYRRISTNIRDSSGKRAVNTMLGTSSAAYTAVNAGQTYIGRAVILGKEYLTAYQPIFAQNSKEVIGILFIGIEMSSIHDTIKESSGNHVKTLIIIAALIMLASILLNTLSSWIILLKPIHTAVGRLKDISEGEGDLTKGLTITSKDEISDMAHYFNLTLEKIRHLIIVIKKQSIALANTGDELAGNMNNTAAAIHQIIQNIQTIKDQVTAQSASVTQTNDTMEQIIANINKLNAYIDQQALSVTQSSAGIEEMVANIRNVTKTLVNNSGNVHNLADAAEAGRVSLQEAAEDIQEIAKESAGLLEINGVMENIASQTNLLSMNAAIEAAHAGEAGKGFAVVADEIRKLAESSREQSSTIAEVLNKIKTSIDKIILSTDSVLQKFEAIDAEIQTVSTQEDTIRNAMEEQGAGSQQILEAIAQLNNLTQMVRSSSQEMQGRSKDVIRESTSLGKVTEALNKGMGQVTTEVDHINYAVTQVNTISRENKENIDDLVQEVSRFKVE